MTENVTRIKKSLITLTKSYPYRITWLNDIHVGAVFGLHAPRWTDNHGITKLPNKGQVILNEYLEDFIEHSKNLKSNILCIPGDVITGKNYFEGGAYVSAIELENQKKQCAAIIADICERVGTFERIWLWRGTGYHGSRDSSVELDVCTKLVADYNLPAEYRGEYSYIDLEYNGIVKTLFVTHTATGATMYPETAMGRDMMKFQESYAQGKTRKVDAIFRAHKHTAIQVEKPTIRSIQLPCWQFFVPYDKAVQNFPMWQPDIGGHITLFDEEMRMTSWQFIYPNVQDSQKIIKVIMEEYLDGKQEESRDRPHCKYCNSPNVISRGKQWQCKDCDRYWKK